ncbi:hypothetical protein [Streptomyces bohaiensis]|uniref:Uncharacterized protein n=1 Tax=Streptomyces bohaiensis TaxID=1431344 RepID=A0ABX1CBS7_9ACTN|nr:hypothetical protein [Streptomyces bohaiensis]NJQ16566.1 hypothetical protein [Streptomyces bohaiensis]
MRCEIAAPGPIRRWLGPLTGGLLFLAGAEPIVAFAVTAAVLLPLRITRPPADPLATTSRSAPR